MADAVSHMHFSNGNGNGSEMNYTRWTGKQALRVNLGSRAVYTGIKKPEFFSLEVARQLPLNTAKKKWIEKPTSEVWFFETLLVFHWFFANVNARSPLAGIFRVFGHVGRDLPESHTQPATYCALCSTTVEGSEKSRMRTTYQKNCMRLRFFRACAFLAEHPNSYGFFWQCKRCNKKTRFFIFWFLPM